MDVEKFYEKISEGKEQIAELYRQAEKNVSGMPSNERSGTQVTIALVKAVMLPISMLALRASLYIEHRIQRDNGEE